MLSEINMLNEIKRYKICLCSDCYQISWKDKDTDEIISNCKCKDHDSISKYTYYQANKEDEFKDLLLNGLKLLQNKILIPDPMCAEQLVSDIIKAVESRK